MNLEASLVKEDEKLTAYNDVIFEIVL